MNWTCECVDCETLFSSECKFFISRRLDYCYNGLDYDILRDGVIDEESKKNVSF